MSSIHIGLILASIILALIYFPIIQVYYPNFYLMNSKSENYFNIDFYFKIIYSAIASCISDDFIGLKLLLSLSLFVFLSLYAFYRMRTVHGNCEKFEQDIREYFVLIWICFLALFVFYGGFLFYGFVVLMVTLVVYSVYINVDIWKKARFNNSLIKVTPDLSLEENKVIQINKSYQFEEEK